jgi:predicted nucleic acid-binding protein
VRGYLLDNNHIDALFRQVPSVVAKYNSIPVDWQIRICNITLGEIEAGNLLANPPDVQKQEEYKNATLRRLEIIGFALFRFPVTRIPQRSAVP